MSRDERPRLTFSADDWRDVARYLTRHAWAWHDEQTRPSPSTIRAEAEEEKRRAKARAQAQAKAPKPKPTPPAWSPPREPEDEPNPESDPRTLHRWRVGAGLALFVLAGIVVLNVIVKGTS